MWPADGRVVVVGRTRDPYLDRDAIELSVFMNVFNAHSNRSPVDGVVQRTRYHAGSFVNGFGSRVDVYLPLHAIAKASMGDKAYATSTAIAVIPLP